MLILFDLDDTLLDHTFAFDAATTAVHRISGVAISSDEFARRWSASHRRNFDRYLSRELTYEEQRRARVRETVDSRLDDAEADRIFDHYLAAYESSWRLFGDVLPCLNALAGARLGVITNGQPLQQRRKLARFSIADRFEHVVVPEECGHAKPDPRIFAAACAKFGREAGSAVYVGDSYEIDACAARAAGLHGVWLDRSGTASHAHAAPVIATLTEFSEVVLGSNRRPAD